MIRVYFVIYAICSAGLGKIVSEKSRLDASVQSGEARGTEGAGTRASVLVHACAGLPLYHVDNHTDA